MRTLPALLSVVLLAPLAGCELFFGGGDDDCLYEGAPEADPIQDPGLRNPDTGLCEYFGGGGGGGGGCGDWGGGATEPDRAPAPDWGQCLGYCDGLGEDACLAASGCRAAYVSDCPEGQLCGNTTYTFWGCWQTAPSGPVQGGDCSVLDAYECSRHDDCVANHYPSGCGTDALCEPGFVGTDIGNFESCAPEGATQPGCFEDWECGSGQRCNAQEVCLPSPWACSGGGDDEEPGLVPCDDRCYGNCVPTDPDPGNCYEAAICDSIPPGCPDGTIAGVKDGCWTGYCIPVANCEPAPACAETPTEDGCIARADCAPIYQGVNCTCDANGTCTCEDWLYQECAAS
ncbi:MAG TPA: hypothetical protein VML75_27205 [Kofleriaceae bacterium]|nr:hypothetical protein [Kofleriaceae bacterium]